MFCLKTEYFFPLEAIKLFYHAYYSHKDQVKLNLSDYLPLEKLQSTIIPKKEEPCLEVKREYIPKIEYIEEKTPCRKELKDKMMSKTPNKNIIKNYTRAMLSFAVSKTAVPYLQKFVHQEQSVLNLCEFRTFLKNLKEDMNSIRNLRELLIIKALDSEKVVLFKKMLKMICIVFLKFFSVNWIYNSRMNDKFIHLKYRFKILKKIKDPKHFMD